MSVGAWTSAQVFGGGSSVPVPDVPSSPTFGSTPHVPAAGATSFAADASSPISHPTAGAGTFAGGASAGDASAAISLSAPAAGSAPPSGSEVVLSQADASAVSWFAAGANHIDAPVQWFANFVVTPDSFSAPTPQMSNLALPSAAETVAAAPVASVFASESHDSWSGSDDSFAVSGLPFTHDVNFDDTPIYTASSDTPWIFTADFTGDGWFFA